MLLYQEQSFRMILTMRLPSPSKYREGQMISGDIPNASAMSLSPRGHERDSVDDASPASRESAARDVPRFFSAAIMSAECQSGCIMPPPRQ